MAYVPPGGIVRGEALATRGASGTVRCTLCHGADLKGMVPVPGIAARSPIYVVGQLSGFQHALRDGLWTGRFSLLEESQ